MYRRERARRERAQAIAIVATITAIILAMVVVWRAGFDKGYNTCIEEYNLYGVNYENNAS